MLKPTDTYKMINLSALRSGNEDKDLETYREATYLVYTSKRLEDSFAKPLIENIMHLDGINGFKPAGLYSFVVTLAPTFSEEEVIKELGEILERAHSDLILPEGQANQVIANIANARKKYGK